MAQQTRWARGEFCWYELGTTDVDAAKSFYGSLFGWTTMDVPMGPMGIYTLLKHDGQDLAGLYKLEGPQFAGVPPHWMAYVATESVDQDTAKAKSLGGKAFCEPMDIPNVGRMSVIQDPQGATISLFQAGQHPGTGKWNGAPNTFCWSELYAKDTAAAVRFYTSLFGWGAKADTSAKPYTEWQVGGRSVGGMIAIDPNWGPVPSHWTSYVAVTDCDAVFKKAQGLGAKALVPPTTIGEVGRFAIFHDPQGAAIAIIKLEKR